MKASPIAVMATALLATSLGACSDSASSAGSTRATSGGSAGGGVRIDDGRQAGSASDGGALLDGGAPSMGADEAAREPLPPSAGQVDEDDAEPMVSNPFVRTEDDPFSTFAADVDTASYDIFARSVRNGYLPSPSTVRVEEFINYFHYDYPTPSLQDERPFSISLAASPQVTEAETTVLRVGIQGALPTERAAANLVFLVDVSGSMAAENKLPLVRRVMHETLDVLDGGDAVSIVGYASNTSVRLEPTGLSERALIEQQIDALQAGGSTNGGSGIELAYAQARAGMIEGGINHVVLCTDGDFNLGITDHDELVALIERERQDGITLTALGVGERNNDAMMERVSNAGNGIYSVLYDEDQAIRYAHESLLNSMVHIAKDMKIQVEFNPSYVHAYRLLGYENRRVADSDFRDDSVDGGEVGAGHRVTALYEVALDPSQLPQDIQLSSGDADADTLSTEVLPEEMVRVKVRYEAPGTGEDAKASEVFKALGSAEIKASFAEADADTRWAIAVATYARILRGDPELDEVNPASLREVFAALAGPEADTERREFLALFDTAQTLK